MPVRCYFFFEILVGLGQCSVFQEIQDIQSVMSYSFLKKLYFHLVPDNFHDIVLLIFSTLHTFHPDRSGPGWTYCREIRIYGLRENNDKEYYGDKRFLCSF